MFHTYINIDATQMILLISTKQAHSLLFGFKSSKSFCLCCLYFGSEKIVYSVTDIALSLFCFIFFTEIPTTFQFKFMNTDSKWRNNAFSYMFIMNEFKSG